MESNKKTTQKALEILEKCRLLFEKKTIDYGTSWRILRLPSLTDQILIKATRIRNIQELGKQKVDDSIENEFIGIINYSIISLIQSHINNSKDGYGLELSVKGALELYNDVTKDIIILLENKNHDYGEAWRNMRITSITDLILQKLIRIKSIEDNKWITSVSEGVNAGYQDIVNYSIFSMILMSDKKPYNIF